MAYITTLQLLSGHLSTHEALSGILGSISLATWIFLLVPQLVLNYRTGSADGISLYFLGWWFIGDLANLSGAIWADLVPTVIALAIYFCIADVVLISQCAYYNRINAAEKTPQDSTTSALTEDEPLLARRRSSDDVGLPGSRRRRSSALSSSQHQDSISKILEENQSDTGVWLKNLLSILGIIIAGIAGWALAWRSGAWMPTPEKDNAPTVEEVAIGAEILGYFSALCYLGARIPQIIKNHRDKSCEGLALLFFILSLMGNLTYGAGILCHSLEREYIMTNLPWLIGSLGTMAEDAIIFMQFKIYADKTSPSAVE